MSVTVITPGAGSSITSTTTVSTPGPGGFIPCSFFRTAFFLAARWGLAPAVGFVPFPRADLETLLALPRTAACLLRGLARFFGRTFARFFRLAMIIPPTLLSAALILL